MLIEVNLFNCILKGLEDLNKLQLITVDDFKNTNIHFPHEFSALEIAQNLFK